MKSTAIFGSRLEDVCDSLRKKKRKKQWRNVSHEVLTMLYTIHNYVLVRAGRRRIQAGKVLACKASLLFPVLNATCVMLTE